MSTQTSKRTRKATRPPEAPLDLALVPWLIATALVTLVPHVDAVPPWLATGAGLVIAWRVWLWRRDTLASGKWLLIGLAAAATIGIVVEFRTIFGRDPGVALLVLLMSLKLLELRSTRDATVIVMLAYFLLLTHYFYADSIPVGLWMLLALIVATATLIRLQAPRQGTPYDTVKHAGMLVMQSVPIMLILFVLFPRISGPLWGLPQDQRKASSGLTDEMSPGSISELSQSSALAFRAEFKDRPPSRDLLYWRGPVMNEYDGKTWRMVRTGNLPPPGIEATPTTRGANAPAIGRVVEYALTLEPHGRRWLLALDLPVRYPADAFLTSSLSVVSRTPLRERRRIELASVTQYRAGVDESTETLKQALALPRAGNPRSRALAANWRKESDNPVVLAAKALQLFQRESFVYTLKPPLLGPDAIDEFLFTTRRGFCEHYASSFAFLMRAAGVPARIVAGYLGGELNPIDGHLAVRQSDAHAWAEIWIHGEGWRRVDPTAAIAPNRVEQGLQGALPEGEAAPALLADVDWLRAARYRWDAIDYAWNLWVLGYDAERQRRLLGGIGLDRDWQTLVSLLAASMGLLLVVLAAWISRRRQPADRAQALWMTACDELAKRGLPRLPAEGPTAYAHRISCEAPALGVITTAIASRYIHLRYATGHNATSDRGRELYALSREVGRLAPRWKLWSISSWPPSKT